MTQRIMRHFMVATDHRRATEALRHVPCQNLACDTLLLSANLYFKQTFRVNSLQGVSVQILPLSYELALRAFAVHSTAPQHFSQELSSS